MATYNSRISRATIRRLPTYRRYLNDLRKKNVEKVSSSELSEMIGYTASQIRQDLNAFGGFGQQGYGYNVEDLFREISIILGLDKEHPAVVVGLGNIGHAITRYNQTYRIGLTTIGLFDLSSEIIGTMVDDMVVRDATELPVFLQENAIDVGVICVEANSAQEVADTLVAGGVKGIWNFAPVDLVIPSNVAVENVHLSEGLHTLTYMIRSNEIQAEKERKRAEKR